MNNPISPFIINSEERAEIFAAHIERYKNGEIGPLTFQVLCQRLGIPKDDIDDAKKAHVDACAAALLKKYEK